MQSQNKDSYNGILGDKKVTKTMITTDNRDNSDNTNTRNAYIPTEICRDMFLGKEWE
jgi:hypothetical protein